MLLSHVHGTHVDLTLETKIGGRGGKCDAVLAGARLGDDFALVKMLGEEHFGHL